MRISHENKAPVTWRENHFERRIAFLVGIMDDRLWNGDEKSAYSDSLVFFKGEHDDSYKRVEWMKLSCNLMRKVEITRENWAQSMTLLRKFLWMSV